MLKLTIPVKEFFNNQDETFVYYGGCTVELEHSLASISKWEAKYHKRFLTNTEKTVDEVKDYVRFMVVTKDFDMNQLNALSETNYAQIKDYIMDPCTATTFSERSKSGSGRGEEISSELIYYWMIALEIPFECQYWHINRLLTLVKICNIKNAEKDPSKTRKNHRSSADIAAANAARRKKLGTRG